jgi:hypothetical protein
MLARSMLLLLLLAGASCVDPADRARAMLQKMTLEEKITMCHGGVTKYAGPLPQWKTVTSRADTPVRLPATIAWASRPCA